MPPLCLQPVSYTHLDVYKRQGYGYIRTGPPLADDASAYQLAAFVEKPDLVRAQAYLDSGDYLWNRGIFVLKPSLWLDALAICRPDILAACQHALAGEQGDGDSTRLQPCPL